ncbi:FRG domain-containing protein [Marinomonas sp. GJ51-6]|uniref:FRG domain-containing protein n=1 Tax=Marinomonas sp. GJ51-6 TaxID=2992802 RepID=UPI0029350231|nr:FRG domain-containing protein [Marinomonas sp. GJ51-6]WOD08532.1 FRG domain-containing protein [Marinomonas sp. GJ51-6]
MLNLTRKLSEFWKNFNRIVEAQSNMGLEIYRGESRLYEVPLEPSLFRQYRAGKFGTNVPLSALEKSMIEEFKRQSFSSFKTQHSIPNNPLEWFTLAQHYGLPTRLIDWTTNPMVALYFAIEKNDDEDGYIYFNSNIEIFEYESADSIVFEKGEMLINGRPYNPHQYTILSNSSYDINDDSIYHEEIIFHRPKYIDERYSNQCTVLACPGSRDVAFSKFDRERIIIPSIIKPTLRRYLNKIGINSAFIYPGLSGITANITKNFSDEYLAMPLSERHKMKDLFD